MRTHCPRTAHLPWSPGAAADDVRATGLSGFAGREVVVTEKLDGENTTLYADGLHARSPDSAHRPSRAWVKELHGRIRAGIPEGWRVCGENLYARHSLAYEDLDGWFYGFSVWDREDRCQGLDLLDAALARGGTVAWDATSLTDRQRGLARSVARRRDALLTHAVLLVGEEELRRRNGVRPDPVPERVLTARLHRFAPPWPGQAHRTWYVGAGGAVEDTAGVLAAGHGED
ncbi:RNA ligase family protein [Streptomyces subrutilus]|uniref:RNA ligase family protein n=1 Tax=Streptomyces subrutilus TaxID=36818 RepID=UPI002E12769A|nr:hypothetical protein OG479_04145 [Streptomyces subrutilus]